MTNEETLDAPDNKWGGYVDRVYNRLSWLVTTFGIKPELPLNIGTISNLLCVSRTPVREALNRLLADGMIRFEHNYGFYNRPFDYDELSDLFELRSLLEQLSSGLAVQRAEENEVAIVLELLESKPSEIKSLNNPDDLLLRHEELCQKLIGLAGNKEISRIYTRVCAGTRFIYSVYLSDPDRANRVRLDHDSIRSALCRNNIEDCFEALQNITKVQAQNLSDLMNEGMIRLYTRPSAGSKYRTFESRIM